MGVTCTRVVKFVRKPIDGEPSVSYWIVPSVTQIHRKENGVCDPTSVSAVKMRQVGDGVASVTSEKVLKYRHIRTDSLNPTPQTYTTAIVCTSETVRIEFLLYNATNDTVPISTETVTVLDDGTNGDNGTGITDVTNYYAVSSSASTAPTSWQTNVPSMTTDNRYLWNYEVVTLTDGTTRETDKRVIGVYGTNGAPGIPGVGISSITEYYLATAQATGITTDSEGWTTTVQTISPTEKYLWNYEAISYTDGTEYVSNPVIIGAYGDTGEKGKDGTSVSFKGTAIAHFGSMADFEDGYSEFGAYLVDQTPQAVVMTVGSTITSSTATNGDGWLIDGVLWTCAGSVWNEVGAIKGDKGDSISGITNYYYVGTSATSYPPVGSSLWKTMPPTMTATNRYLWNYEVIRISDAFGNTVSTKTTTPRLIGVYGQTGATGVGVSSITEYYLASSAASGVTVETSGWTETVQTISSSKRYLWNYETINYTDGSSFDTEPVVIGVYSQGGTGPRGYRGSKHRQFVWAECDDDQEFMSGQDDDEFFDTVIYRDYIYLCIASHTKISTPPPQDATHWAFAEKWRIVATDVMLAERAVIKFAEGNELRIYDQSDRLKGGLVSLEGNHPLLFIHPRKTPIKITFIFAASSSSTVNPLDGEMSADMPTMTSTNKYLWAQMLVHYSDGTVTYGGKLMVYTFTSSAPTSYALQYLTKNVQSATSDSDAWSDGIEVPTENNQYLYVRLRLFCYTSQISTYMMYAGQYEASTDTSSALFKVMRDGTVNVGEPYGAMIRLKPQFDKSRGLLPRMEIFDTEGAISSTFDGSVVSDTGELYGGTSSTSTASSGRSTGNAQVGNLLNPPYPQYASAEVTLCTLTCGSAGSISLSALNVRFDGAKGSYTVDGNVPLAYQYGLIELVVGGDTISQRTFYFDNETTGTVSFPAKTVLVGAGVFSIVLRARAFGYTGTWASASTLSSLTAQYNADKYISRYFANGLCLGSAANNHFSILNIANKLAMELISNNGSININNGTVGMMADGSTFKQMRSGRWLDNQPATIFMGLMAGTASGGSFTKYTSWNGAAPTIARTSTGVYTLTFPSSWRDLNISTTTCFAQVTGYGTNLGGSNPNKAQVRSLTSTSIVVVMSDDETPNDGSFFIELKLY